MVPVKIGGKYLWSLHHPLSFWLFSTKMLVLWGRYDVHVRLVLFFVYIQVWSEKAENKIANGSPESQAQVTVDVNRNSTKTPNNELAGTSAYILLKYF